MRSLLVLFIFAVSASATAEAGDVVFVGKVTATEPNIIRMVSGHSEIEIPRKYAVRNYLAGEEAKIAVPSEDAASVKFYKASKH